MSQTVLSVSDAEIQGYNEQKESTAREEYVKQRTALFSRAPDLQQVLDEPNMLDVLKLSPAKTRANEGLMLSAIVRDPRAFAQADVELQHREDFCLKAISASLAGQAFTQMPPEMQQNPACQGRYATSMVRCEHPERKNGETIMLTPYKFDKATQFNLDKYGEIYQRKIDSAISGVSTDDIRKIRGSSYLVAAEAAAKDSPELQRKLEETKRRVWELPRNVERVLDISKTQTGVGAGHTKEILDTASQYSKALRNKIQENQEKLWTQDILESKKNGNVELAIQAARGLEKYAATDKDRAQEKSNKLLLSEFDKYVTPQTVARLTQELNNRTVQMEQQLRTMAGINSREQFQAMVKEKERQALEIERTQTQKMINRVKRDGAEKKINASPKEIAKIEKEEERYIKIIHERQAKREQTIRMRHSIREPSIMDDMEREEREEKEKKMEQTLKRIHEKEMLLAYQKASAIALIYGMAADGEISPDDAALSVARIQSIPNMSKSCATLENIGKLGDIQNDFDNSHMLDRANALSHAIDSGLNMVYVTEAELRAEMSYQGREERYLDDINTQAKQDRQIEERDEHVHERVISYK